MSDTYIDYHPDSDETQGEIKFSLEQVSNDYMLEVSAVANPGYLFDGWYDDSNNILSYLSIYKTFGSNGVVPKLFAKFKKSNYLFHSWENGLENKTLIWRSKRFQNALPINLSSVQINADGYPVKIDVDYASSPNTPKEETQNHVSISVLNQNARRLPMKRPEKYFEIEVLSNQALNDITISTSMGGIINGNMQQQEE